MTKCELVPRGHARPVHIRVPTRALQSLHAGLPVPEFPYSKSWLNILKSPKKWLCFSRRKTSTALFCSCHNLAEKRVEGPFSLCVVRAGCMIFSIRKRYLEALDRKTMRYRKEVILLETWLMEGREIV